MTLSSALEQALRRAGLPEVELSARATSRGVARFSRTELDQSAVLEERFVRARVAREGRVGTATTSDVEPDGILRAIEQAEDAARGSPVVPGFPGFAPASAEPPAPARVAEATAAASPERRAREIGRLLDRVRAGELEAAGLLETTTAEHAVATTAGCRKQARTTIATARFFVMSGDASGYAGGTHRDVDALDLGALGEQALERCLRGAHPTTLSPGTYDVVLEPEAVAELVEWLGYASLGAREVEEGSSALAGRFGERVTGGWVDLADDALDDGELGLGVGFDAEGTNRQRVSLLEKGKAVGPVYDRLHAARAGRASTGHAAPLGSDSGPVATSLWVGAGTIPQDELVAQLGRGVYVSRFHYVNGLLDPRRALMTGMTRDGTFLVEAGRLGQGIQNIRFTDSLLEALGRTEAVSRERRAIPTWWSDGGAIVAPSLLVRGFRFTGEAAP